MIDCWVDNMLLNFTDNSFRDRDGVETKANDFGGTFLVIMYLTFLITDFLYL